MRFRGNRGRRVGRHHAHGDPRGALAVPFIWMLLVCVLSFATIIVTATNSNNENTKVVTGFEAVFYILMYITMCNILKVNRAKMPKTFKAYFCIFMIFAICLIIFCAINISLVQSQNPAILTMTLVQTCLVLGFTICSIFCCFMCNFSQAAQKQQAAAAAASSNIQAQQSAESRSQKLAQNRQANMVNMYQQQLSNQIQMAQQAPGLGGFTPEQIAQQQQQLAYLQQQHQIMMQQLQQLQGAQAQGMQGGLQQQQQNPFPALYQPQFLGVNPQQMPMQQQQQQPFPVNQLPPNYQPFPAMMQPFGVPGQQLPQQAQQEILPNHNDGAIVDRILQHQGVNMRHDSTNVKFSDSNQLNSFMVQRQMTKKTLKEQTANDQNTCPICLVDFENGDNIITLKQCGHYFHQDCLKDWLLKANLTCPLCRSELQVPQNWKKQ